jgi:hypothetical protein
MSVCSGKAIPLGQTLGNDIKFTTHGYKNIKDKVLPLNIEETWAGTPGKDTFVVNAKNRGETSITYFSPVEDKIKILNSKFSNFDALKASMKKIQQRDTRIRLDYEQILTLHGVPPEVLSEKNFDLGTKSKRFSIVMIKIDENPICSYAIEEDVKLHTEAINVKDLSDNEYITYSAPKHASEVIFRVTDSRNTRGTRKNRINLGRKPKHVEIMCGGGKNWITLNLKSAISQLAATKKMRVGYVKIFLPQDGYCTLDFNGISSHSDAFQKAGVHRIDNNTFLLDIAGNSIFIYNLQETNAFYIRTENRGRIFDDTDKEKCMGFTLNTKELNNLNHACYRDLKDCLDSVRLTRDGSMLS